MVKDQIKFVFYLIFHPFNGYWDMKYENRGRLSAALGIVILLFVTVVVKRQYTGFIMNFNNPRTLNSIDELLFILLPFCLFCVANWSLTTLMDGEGKFKEIVTAAGYALVPMVVIYMFTTFASNYLNREESPFLYLLDTVAVIWFAALLFIGMMTVHQFSIGKNVVTLFLTLIAIGVIVFLGMLFFSLIQQMVAFIATIVREFSLRT